MTKDISEHTAPGRVLITGYNAGSETEIKAASKYPASFDFL